jgi:subtilase family serine protease
LGDVGTLFGASPSQYASDVAYFTGYGLSVQQDPGRMTIAVTGTIPQIDAAFHTQIGAFTEQYYSPGVWNPAYGDASAVLNSTTNRTVYLSTQAAYLPGSMGVGSVAGLSTLFAQPQVLSALPGLSPAKSLSSLGMTMTIPAEDQGTTISPTQALGGGSASACSSQNYTWGSLLGINWQFLWPCSMPAVTGATDLWNGLSTFNSEPDQGQDVTIGIVDVGCPTASDLSGFQNYTGVNILDRLTVVAINTPFEYFPNTDPSGCLQNGIYNGWTFETSIDLEYAAAMAPLAHIDLISVGDPSLTSFDSAYQFIAQYLTTGSPMGLPPGSDVINLVTGTTSSFVSAAAATVTITSNSYGTGEELTAIFGTPVYLQLENEALDELAAVGVTSFFASGDYGPTVYPFPLQAAIPADADGVTSVGGGMVTVQYNGVEFPSTGVSTNISGEPMVVAPVTGISTYTYWAEELIYKFSATETIDALPPGEVGGGFGQSSSLPQPWWQNSLDTYSSGALIDPVISGSAAFNMTGYEAGAWQLAYGGTSFATPVFAGEWALVEEQAYVAFGTTRFGDINGLLFAAHNAQQAGAVVTNPFVTMTNIGTGGFYADVGAWGPGTYFFEGLWAPSNLYGTYMLASQDEFPQDQNLPYWYATLNNPAGMGWNYLQGLGLPLATALDNVLIGQLPETQRALDNLPFYVLEVQGSSLVPFTTLVAGSTYTFEIVSAFGVPESTVFSLTAYSGGHTTTKSFTGPKFTYKPAWTTQNPFSNGTEYGYFYLKAVDGAFPPWSFQFFAVAQPLLSSGKLRLGVETPLGLVTTGEAQVPMFAAGGGAPIVTGGQALVTLNGVPVGGATVTQTAVDIPSGAIPDPSIPESSYAPGSVVGTYLSSASGTAAFWTDSGQEYVDYITGLEASGWNYTDVVPPTILPVSFTLEATYDGLTSNIVTVVAEPQSGYFDQQLELSKGHVVGHVEFYSMNYLNYLNVSDGSSPGMFENVSFPANTVYTGTLAVRILAPGTGPVVVSIVGAGQATFGITGCGMLVGYGNYFAICGFNPPNTFTFVWGDPVVFLPASLTASGTGSTVTGDDTFTFAGTSVPGAAGSLLLVSPGGTTTLASGISGSYTLDTSSLPDGWYTVEFVETAPSLAPTVQDVSFYADNQAASANALITQLESELSADATTIASLSAQVASLQASLNAANADIAGLQAQITSLQGEVSALGGELATAQAQVASLQSQISTLQGENSTNTSEVATLESELTAAQGQVTTDLTQMASLTAEVQTLQNELNAKKNSVAPAWYDTIGTAGVVLLVVLGALVVGLVAYFGGKRVGRNSRAPTGEPAASVPIRPEGGGVGAPERTATPSHGGGAWNPMVTQAPARSDFTSAPREGPDPKPMYR